MRQEPKPLELYRHFKGNVYQIKCIATHSETQERLVIYQAMYGSFEIYARPLSMFLEEVDRSKYPNVTQRYRFEKMDGEDSFTAVSAGKTSEEKQPERAEEVKQNTPQAGEIVSQTTAENGFAEEEFYVDPQVFEFLDAKTAEQKLELLAKLHHKLDDNMIDIMASAMDLEIKKGDIEQRYEELKHCLLVIDRFECTRLRG